ncbi:hypothetical protein CRU87_08035 [Aliarcobacter trophiarum LMG 25534]|uniref:VCBS repeat-containing protein n=1 Tax=Aliarcobacter trophiarum LMG 25534 TaxID=1032241 RepID=A0AAD0VLT8_9BACT|nr:hypothetical protein [Aliarcobacter trophiarum]AXK48529.1 hypothetical protein ATR_0660 [Aliarcobacter trophiarum LMG 25534]RXI27618.1 hypothetical protein CRU89_04910 [Aliarcobacter trophiarum]RXJ89926.1 hypothetical protein CRU87_08035 [Aliarcobacter trophiarum LMG 25534]
MIIKDSKIELYSSSQSINKHSSYTSLQLHYGAKDENNQNEDQAFKLDISHQFRNITSSSKLAFSSEDMLSPEDRIKKLIIERLLERFSKKDNLYLYPQQKSLNMEFSQNKTQSSTSSFLSAIFKNPYQNEENQNQELKAMVFTNTQEYYQKESIEFAAKVKFNTPNKSYEMSLDLSFSKEFYEKTSTRFVIGDQSFIDPLVINFSEDINPFENISSLKFAFDLDSDGKEELIPYLKAGAGYLALDKNQNGKIDSGKELFGPQTGDGFKELAKYDSDKNGFIDEADEIFSKLKIWSFDEAGNSSLISLLDANVGAIYLSDVQSGFNYKDGINSTLAQQQGNGVFIKEDGSGLGVVNSINIVV